MQNLEGKTVVFFGATGGIGESVCREFQKAGANLVLVARSQDKLAKLKEELGGENIFAISADATSLTDVQKVFAESNNKFGEIDAVVISVGTWIRTSLINSPQEIIEMNDKLEASIAKPVIVVASVAQEVLRKQGRGVIFNMSSHAADSYLQGNLAYAGAKAKTSRFILNLGEELKGTGVSTCDIRPALVDTPQNREGLKNFSEEEWVKAVQPINIAEFVAEHIGSSNIPAIKFFESGIEAK
ncbi:MAG: short-chain dehydrogenase/reductase [Parcubacteria group bacterium Gr01-1014_13]|nr:MAG: short-chain dehydrogenase/reductase [Parcubacteria group bacterium Gr01-1014_13]